MAEYGDIEHLSADEIARAEVLRARQEVSEMLLAADVKVSLKPQGSEIAPGQVERMVSARLHQIRAVASAGAVA